MTMKTPLIFALFCLSTATALTAQAQTYQWKDSSGRTVISDTPPPGSARDARGIGLSPPPSSSAPKADVGKAADAPKTAAEKDMEFRKRQQEAREKAEKSEKEAAAAAQKRDNCERARNQLSKLESGNHRMVVPDGKGGEVFVEGDVKEAEMERARKIIAESCN
jgi:hypothetical protein